MQMVTGRQEDRMTHRPQRSDNILIDRDISNVNLCQEMRVGRVATAIDQAIISLDLGTKYVFSAF